MSLGPRDLGSFPVDNTVAPGATDDEAGRASVSVTLPAGLPVGDQTVTVVGDQTGTTAAVPVNLEKAEATVDAEVTPRRVVARKTRATVKVSVLSAGGPASGEVEVTAGGNTYEATLDSGEAHVRLAAFDMPGTEHVRVEYLGNDSTAPSGTTVTIEVVKK